MALESDGLSMQVGTLGGFVSTYDFRYSVRASLYEHDLKMEVLAIATKYK